MVAQQCYFATHTVGKNKYKLSAQVKASLKVKKKRGTKWGYHQVVTSRGLEKYQTDQRVPDCSLRFGGIQEFVHISMEIKMVLE